MVHQRIPSGHPILTTPAIWHPDPAVSRHGYSVVLFRKEFTLDREADECKIYISASQRYILYLDGKELSRGPSRSDPLRWGVRTLETGALSKGTHVCAVQVFHFGQHAGIGQLGNSAFLLLHTESSCSQLQDVLTTGTNWKCFHDKSHAPLAENAWRGFASYNAVGSGEKIDGKLVPWGWQKVDFDSSRWVESKIVCKGAEDPWGNVPLQHILRYDPLPEMERETVRFTRVAEAPSEYAEGAKDLIDNDMPCTIAPNQTVRIILDRGVITNAYIQFGISGGENSEIRIVTAESAFIPGGKLKGNRDETEGKEIRGQLDCILPGGEAVSFESCKSDSYSTLWFRSFRYAELQIKTGTAALTFCHILCESTRFPLRNESSFQTDSEHDSTYRAIQEINFRTISLCAHETFFDCPHYEQAQFPGDTRIQALFHYLVCNEDRLARKAIDDFHASRIPEGLTQCRYPSRSVQILPTFSLYWIGMLYDFCVYRGDRAFVAHYMPFAREIMRWFTDRVRQDGMLGYIEYAPFTDWTPGFKYGNAPQDPDGGSSVLTLLLATACDWMKQLELWCGSNDLSTMWHTTKEDLTGATLEKCWDTEKDMLADTPGHVSYSQHAHAHAVLAGALTPEQGKTVLSKVLGDDSVIAPGSFYFRYYIMQAFKKCNLQGNLFSMLHNWEKLLSGTGLSTWPETEGPLPRSDCHAWSVTPGIEFIETILGVQPDPSVCGYERILFNPTPGPLSRVSGSFVIPRGPVSVCLEKEKDNDYRAQVKAPVEMLLAGSNERLAPGEHSFTITCQR